LVRGFTNSAWDTWNEIMNDITKEALERKRKGHGWPDDDLLVVIYVKQKDKEKIESLLYLMGIGNNDAVEVVPE
jgi:hypothetical protein